NLSRIRGNGSPWAKCRVGDAERSWQYDHRRGYRQERYTEDLTVQLNGEKFFAGGEVSRHGKLWEHELCNMRGILVRGRSSRFTAVVVTLAFGVLLAGASRLPANSAGLAQAQSTQKDVYDTPGPPPAPVQPVPYSHKA